MTPETNAGDEVAPNPEDPHGQQATDRPVWRRPTPLAIGAAVIVAAGGVAWAATSPAVPPAAITVTQVYAPQTDSNNADVYFTLSNTGAGTDTLERVNAEYQTGSAAKSVTLCADASCSGASTVDISATATTLFQPDGPYIEVTGLGPLRRGHQPLQLTLTFKRSGTLHVLAPVGTPADLTMMDVMNYGFMGHASPGDGMDMPGGSSGATKAPSTGMGDMPSMTGMPSMPPTTSSMPSPMPSMPGMTMGNN